METPRPDDAVSPGKPPQWLVQHTVPAPQDAAPSHGPSAMGWLYKAPSFHPRRCWGLTSSRIFSCLLPPTTLPQVCKQPLFPQLKLSLPHAQSKHRLSSPCTNHSEGTPAPAAPMHLVAAVPQEAAAVPEQELCWGNSWPCTHTTPQQGDRHAGETKALGQHSNSPS